MTTLSLSNPPPMPKVRATTSTLTSRALKIVLVLDPVAVSEALQPYRTSEKRIPLNITVERRKLTCDFPPRAVRRCIAVLDEHGPDAVSVIIQGRLGPGDVVLDAGLVAAPRIRKSEEAT